MCMVQNPSENHCQTKKLKRPVPNLSLAVVPHDALRPISNHRQKLHVFYILFSSCRHKK